MDMQDILHRHAEAARRVAVPAETRTVSFVATSISEARGMWMAWAERQKREPYLVRADVKRVGSLVEWTVTYLPETPEDATDDHPLGCIRGMMFAAPVSLALYAVLFAWVF